MNQQFINYMQVFDVKLIYKLMYAAGDVDITSNYNTRKNLLERLTRDEIQLSNAENPMLCFTSMNKELESVEDIVYRLSNEFMEMSVQDNPYDREMTLPLNEKNTHILILMKYLASYNRLVQKNENKPLELSQELLDGLSTNISIDTLKTLWGYEWARLPSEGPGHIKYNLSFYNTLIEETLTKLTKIKEDYDRAGTAVL